MRVRFKLPGKLIEIYRVNDVCTSYAAVEQGLRQGPDARMCGMRTSACGSPVAVRSKKWRCTKHGCSIRTMVVPNWTAASLHKGSIPTDAGVTPARPRCWCKWPSADG